jgi:hypothetical protein
MIDLGDVFRIRVEVKTLDGVLTDPGAAVLTVTLPDGTTETPAVTLPPEVAGVMVVDFPTTQAGRHSFVLSTTDPQTAYRDVFDVRTSELHQIISLADTKTHLRITNTGSDEQLRSFIEAATSVIEYRVRTVVSRSHTETHDVRGPMIPLRHYPVQEITSIEYTAGGSIDVGSVDVDEVGIVRMGSGWFRGRLSITYTAGHIEIPSAWVQAAKIIVQHMWDTQRPQDSRRPATAYAEDTMSVADHKGRFYSIPRRAVELLESDMVPVVG